ncbi:MAG TPA: GNAT family N-acetyltransferase [Cytophagales bacterium]|nr:GNAT family N-acetyltransferase [Cytophagales bacterium]
MDQVVIKKAEATDVPVLQIIGKETFLETFTGTTSDENMKKYVALHFNEGQVSKELSHPNSEFFIAWQGTSPIGYLKLNYGDAQTELQDEDTLEIERIYVKSSHHGKKVGQLLYQKALERALHAHKSYMWLGVWEENKRAVRFYENNGFVAFDKHIFMMGDEAQTDIMMRKALVDKWQHPSTIKHIS